MSPESATRPQHDVPLSIRAQRLASAPLNHWPEVAKHGRALLRPRQRRQRDDALGVLANNRDEYWDKKLAADTWQGPHRGKGPPPEPFLDSGQQRGAPDAYISAFVTLLW